MPSVPSRGQRAGRDPEVEDLVHRRGRPDGQLGHAVTDLGLGELARHGGRDPVGAGQVGRPAAG